MVHAVQVNILMGGTGGIVWLYNHSGETQHCVYFVFCQHSFCITTFDQEIGYQWYIAGGLIIEFESINILDVATG